MISSRVYVDVRPEQQIPFAQPHPAAVGQKIANGHLMRNIRVVHHEAGKTLVHRIVPGELARIYQPSQSSGGECFCVRADAEHGVLVDRRGIAQLAHAVAFGEDDLAVFHNGNGHSRDLEGPHGIGDVGIQISRGRSLGPERGGGSDKNRGNQTGKDQFGHGASLG